MLSTVELEKYKPFLEFVVAHKLLNYDKLLKIKGWIENKESFPEKTVQKMEDSIRNQYKKLCTESSIIIPKDIAKIFVMHITEAVVVDLSDEEIICLSDTDAESDCSENECIVIDKENNEDIDCTIVKDELFKRRTDFESVVSTNEQFENVLETVATTFTPEAESIISYEQNLPNAVEFEHFPTTFTPEPEPIISHAQNLPNTVGLENVQHTFYAESTPVVPKIQSNNLNDPRILKQLQSIVQSHGNEACVNVSAKQLLSRLVAEPDKPVEKKRSVSVKKVDSEKMVTTEHAAKKPTSAEKLNEAKTVTNCKEDASIRQQLKNVLLPFGNEITKALKKTASIADTSPLKETSTSRELKKLNCTFKGFSEVSDYITTSICGKRRSSISARKAINELISFERNSFQMKRRKTMDCRDPSNCRQMSLDEDEYIAESNTISLPRHLRRKRRKTIHHREDIEYTIDENKRITERRKSTKTRDDINLPADKSCGNSSYKGYENQPMKDCRVKLNRLQDLNKTAPTPMPTPTPSDKQPASNSKNSSTIQKTKKNQLITEALANDNFKMTERNTKKCILCNKNFRKLTSHYLNTHKTESYISRLTARELECLKANNPVAEVTIENKHNPECTLYKVECYFCNHIVVGNIDLLHQHFSSHTGEFAFQCNYCSLLRPSQQEIRQHLKNSKCKGTKPIRLYIYRDDLKAINLHYCKICNFVQLNKANVERHQLQQHLIVANRSQSLGLCVLADLSYNIETSEQNTIQELSNKDAVPKVVNEPLSQEEIVIDIKPDPESIESNNLVDDCTVPPPMVQLEAHSSLQAKNNSLALPSSPIISRRRTVIESAKLPQRGNVAVTPPATSTSLGVSSNEYAYRLYPKNTHYFGLYKCMADDCFFSSDEQQQFLQHLHTHQEYGIRLNCAYCAFEAEKSQNLSEHIRKVHIRSRYQCSICSYRSCVPSNVLMHQALVHNIESGTEPIYKCAGEDLNINVKGRHISNQRFINVKKHKCSFSDCSEGFYAIEFLKKHLQLRHHIRSWHENVFKYYSCIYCPDDFKAEKEIQKHLALKHPDELVFACQRILAPGYTSDGVHNILIQEVLQDASTPNTIDVQNTDPFNTTTAQTSSEREISSEQALTNDLKPDRNELMWTTRTLVENMLLKLSSFTGVALDKLFKCPICKDVELNFTQWYLHIRNMHECGYIRCPHCPENHVTLECSDNATSRKHLTDHQWHLYFCFYCGESFAEEQSASGHFKLAHAAHMPMRKETLSYKMSFTFSIFVQNDMHTEPLEFYQSLLPVLNARLEHVKEASIEKITSKWLITDDHLDYLGYDERITGLIKMKKIKFFGCLICPLNRIFDRRSFVAHVEKEHKLRDVPALSLMSTAQESSIEMSISIVFAEDRRTISTLKNCFCCESSTVGQPLAQHLQKVHKILLRYFCEVCNERILKLNDVEEHFKTAHNSKVVKIRCELASIRKLEITTSNPFRVHIGDYNDNDLNPQAIAERIQQENLRCSRDGDSDCEIVDDDDSAICEDLNKIENQNKSTSLIRVKNVQNLLSTPATTASTSLSINTYPSITQQQTLSSQVYVIPRQTTLSIRPLIPGNVIVKRPIQKIQFVQVRHPNNN